MEKWISQLVIEAEFRLPRVIYTEWLYENRFKENVKTSKCFIVQLYLTFSAEAFFFF